MIGSRRAPSSPHPLLWSAAFAYLLLLGMVLALGQAKLTILALVPAFLLIVYTRPLFGLGIAGSVFFLGQRIAGLGFLPLEIGWLPDLVLLALLSRVLVKARHRRVDFGGPVWWAVLALGILAAGSTLVNRLDLVSALVGFRGLFRLVLFYFAVINLGLSLATLRRCVIALLVIAMVQVPVSVVQLVVSGGVADVNSGTMQIHGGLEMAFLCTAAAAILVCLHLQRSRRLWMVLAVVALLIPGLAAGARGASLVFFPFALFLALALNLARSARVVPRRVIAATLILLVMGALVFAAGVYRVLVTPNAFSSVGEVLETESISGTAFGRLTSIENAVSMVRESPIATVFGLGPGVTGESQFAYGRAWEMVSAVEAFRTQVATSIVELGYLGLVVMLTIPVLFLLGLPPARLFEDRFWLAVRMAVPVVIVIYVLGFLYFRIWYVGSSSFLIWVLIAAVRVAGRKETHEGATGTRIRRHKRALTKGTSRLTRESPYKGELGT